MRRTALCCSLAVALAGGTPAPAAERMPERQSAAWQDPAPPAESNALADAQRLFYNGHYPEAAAAAVALRASDTDDLANIELRTSALLFQLRGLLDGRGNAKAAWDACASCPELLAAFSDDIHRGQTRTRAMLEANPKDPVALFFLGKLDLNYIWLQLGPLGHRTGWNEYWEARHSLDTLLEDHPRHVRARVARAWIDYIVATRTPWGTRWLLGGGNRKQALASVREAAALDAEFFAHVEAEFALWEMLVREREGAQAREVAHRLGRLFPENRQVAAFISAHPPERPAPR
ncbi:MAG: hypothetical protein ABUS56_05125 [Acidobacteriota bacterium]